ncbi:MAG TPA: carboxypeptidase-like regulatory domain-containing protein [Thermoanaerobaculia bacterium]|nr:carboxypeptidase-like regulatory domain-containing protein [Thermoanaerobaculia bacterium]
MKRCPSFSFRAAASALLVVLLAVSASAQLQTGNIYGKVTQRDGTTLPGVSVTLTGIGAPQTFFSDAGGNFRFLNLSPGTYQLKADLSGFGSAVRQGVGVSIGQNADVTLVLSASMADSITVTAEAPLLDTRKAGTAINVTRVELEQIPTSRDPWTVLQQAPGVQVDRIWPPAQSCRPPITPPVPRRA